MIWKLLPIALLVSCAATEPRDTTSVDDGSSESFRVIGTLDIPLVPAAETNPGQPRAKGFRRMDTQGSVRETGAWNISTVVAHSRVRCGTYETGIQLGTGNPACTEVQWLTNAQYGTRHRQCNSATLIHAGGGQFSGMEDIVKDSTCVRVVTRCSGNC